MNDSVNLKPNKSITELLPSNLINDMEKDNSDSYDYQDNSDIPFDENLDDDEIVDDLAFKPKETSNTGFKPLRAEPKSRFHSDSTIQMLYQYQRRQQMQSQWMNTSNTNSAINSSNSNTGNTGYFNTPTQNIQNGLIYTPGNQGGFFNHSQLQVPPAIPFMINTNQQYNLNIANLSNLSLSQRSVPYNIWNTSQQNTSNIICNNCNGWGCMNCANHNRIIPERKGTFPQQSLQMQPQNQQGLQQQQPIQQQILNGNMIFNPTLNNSGYPNNNNMNNTHMNFLNNQNPTNFNTTNNGVSHPHRKNNSSKNVINNKNNDSIKYKTNTNQNKNTKKVSYDYSNKKSMNINSIASSSKISSTFKEENFKQSEIEKFEKYISSLPNGIIDSLCNQKGAREVQKTLISPRASVKQY